MDDNMVDDSGMQDNQEDDLFDDDLDENDTGGDTEAEMLGGLGGGFGVPQPGWTIWMGLHHRIRLYATSMIFEAISPMIGEQV